MFDVMWRRILELGATGAYVYPYPADEHGVGSLCAVIRQWAEEPPSETLRNQLAAYSQWNDVLVKYASLAGDDEAVTLVLSESSVPATLATVRHFTACVQGKPNDALPSRGILVSTNMYAEMRTDEDTGQVIPQRSNATTTSMIGNIELLTVEILSMAQGIALRHREFIERFGRLELADKGKKARAHPSAQAFQWPNNNALSYIRYAMDLVDAEMPVLERKWVENRIAFDQAMTRILDRAYDNVSQNRRRKGLEVNPKKIGESGWREVVKNDVEDQLRSVNH